jgi:subtilisin family serine protease
MKSVLRLLVFVGLALGLCAPKSSAQNVTTYILESPTLAQAQAACQTYGLTMVSTLHNPDVFLVQSSASLSTDTLKQLTANDPNVKHLQATTKFNVPENQLPPAFNYATLPSTTYATGWYAKMYGSTTWLGYVLQPAVFSTNAYLAMASGNTGQGIIAVIDTGVDPTSGVLAPVLLPGYDFTQNLAGTASELGDVNQSTAHILFQSTAHILFSYQSVPLTPSTTALLDSSTAAAMQGTVVPNDFGHGTMVAGLIHLVAPAAQIMPLKAFAPDGTADEANIIAAIYYATDNGASVINMSFGLPQISDAMMKAINYASRKGVVCVASVGNNSQNALVYPAAFGNVIGVASVNLYNQASAFTNYGPDIVTVAAPGEALITTYPGNHYAAVWGTSFSAALVSGGVDLLIQASKDSLTSQLNEADYARALKHANACVTDGSLGAGCMDLNQAVKFIQSMNMSTSTSGSGNGNN